MQLAVLALIVEGAWKSGLAKKSPRPAFSVIVAVVFAIILATAGLIYSWYLLTPMLLDYLETDFYEHFLY